MTMREITGGFHLKDLEPNDQGQPRCLHALEMIFNWRLVRSIGKCDHVTSGYDRGYCYKGKGLDSLAILVAQAIMWDGSDDSEPTGWIKAHRLGPWQTG